MLTKLIKYEFKSVYKTYLPLYGVVLMLALANRIMASFNNDNFGLPQGLMMTAYVMFMTGIVFVTLFLGVMRFRTNILKDEGYLMLTLPVARWKLTLSKLIAAVAWSIMGIAVGIASILIMVMNDFSIGFSVQDFVAVKYVGLGTIFIYLLLFAIVIILAITAAYSPIYFALALGHAFNKNKTIMSFISYMGICFAWQMVGVIAMASVGALLFSNGFFSMAPPNIDIRLLPMMVFIPVLTLLLIYNGVNFFATNYLLKNKLNLE